MDSKVFKVFRIMLGLILLVYGLNKFFHYMPGFEGLSDAAKAYLGELNVAYTFKLIGLVESLAGLAFILNKYGALMAIILMSVSVNVVLFHTILNPENIGLAITLLVLNIAVLYGYKDKYKAILAG